MTLREYLDKLLPSDRIIIFNQNNTELFRGFGTGGKYVHADLDAEVLGFRTAVELYKRRVSRDEERMERKQLLGEPKEYVLADVEIQVFNKVVIST